MELCTHTLLRRTLVRGGRRWWPSSLPGVAELTAGIGLGIAFLFPLDVTLGTAQNANHHHDLYRRYVQLDGAIDREGLNAEAILSRTRDIEADEPPIIETFRVFAYR